MLTVFHVAAFLALLHSSQQKQLLQRLAEEPRPERPCILVTGVPEVDCADPVPPRLWNTTEDPEAPPVIDPRVMPIAARPPGPHIVPETVGAYPASRAMPVVLDVDALTVIPAYVLAAIASGVAPEVLFEYTRPRAFPKGIK